MRCIYVVWCSGVVWMTHVSKDAAVLTAVLVAGRVLRKIEVRIDILLRLENVFASGVWLFGADRLIARFLHFSVTINM